MIIPKTIKTLAARLFAAALLLSTTVSAVAGVHYVDVNSFNATPPYTNWTTAATNIQDAVDAAVAGDEVVVTNGVYYLHGQGSTLGLVTVDKPLNVRSVNGPQSTTIDGGNSDRCAYLTNGSSLSGFTLTRGNGSGQFGGSGGGVSGYTGGYGAPGTLTNCVLSGNVASFGGGAHDCTLNNCTLTGNQVVSGVEAIGGGAWFCTLNNCVLTGNSAIDTVGTAYVYGGGAADCTLNNCTLAYNSASGTHSYGGGAYHGGFLRNCIVYFNTARLGPNLYENFPIACWTQSDPLFVNRGNNLHLQSNSPCINAGWNDAAAAGPDLDGNSRITGGTVDIGAYEYQSPVSMISYAWLQQFHLPINPATDTADPDGDGVDNYREWLAGSDPTNPFSFPPLLTLIPYGANVILTWPTNAVGFTLQATTNLGSPDWSTNSSAPIVIGGQNTVTNPVAGPQQFYRLSQ